MATKNDDLPDLDAEREVDLRRYWNTIATHWWLPLAGLAAGIVIGYLISLGGTQVYKAKAVVYLGQPLSSGGLQVQSVATNPSTVRQIVLAPATINAVARQVGLKPGQLRGQIATQSVTGNITRLGQNPLVSITVTGRFRGKVARAADALAEEVVSSDALAGYAKEKIANLEALVTTEQAALKSLDTSTRQLQDALGQRGGLSTTERLILLGQLNGLQQQRLTTTDQLTTNQQQLSLAKKVEAPTRIGRRAVAIKTTARSRRNTVLVSALIGLILGGIAALLFDPARRVVRRHS
jgi:hypothetical protein